MSHSDGNSGHGPDRNEIAEVLQIVAREAATYLESLDTRVVRSGNVDEVSRRFIEPLPEQGVGAAAALRTLMEQGSGALTSSAGPRFFHFVTGGSTPAAMGADLFASVVDQIAFAWISSPLGVELERLSLKWLREIFDLPGEWGEVMTTGATMANFVGLASARQWWGEKLGSDVGEDGLNGLPQMPVLTSGYIHASAVKALSMLGLGRSSVRKFTRDDVGRIDLAAMKRALIELDGQPAVIIGNAGEVNAGDFDPIDELADLAGEHGAWLHVDGAFGLFARVSPRTASLAAGVERAQSITVDGHKWLNVPYDCGFAFVREPRYQSGAFAYSAAYLPKPGDPRPNFGVLGPESSRRARAFSVWATLKAYGRQGCRRMVEGHLDLARHLGALVDASPEFERLADVQLNIVCFRYNPGNKTPDELNELNRKLGEAILEDGRVFVGTTDYAGKTALRPAIVNWRTRREDIDLLATVVTELAANL
jgi:glutamate/tyrosine decarboxylase-like PLP-dependent enzyme